MTQTASQPATRLGLSRPSAVAALFVARHPERFLPTLQSLAGELDLPVVLGATHVEYLDQLESLATGCVETWSLATLVNDVWLSYQTSILAISDPILAPPGFLEHASALIVEDVRVATVSFFSNDAAFLSFPQRNQAVERAVDGHDARSITRALREESPSPRAVPIPHAAGSAVVLSASGLATVGPLENPPSGRFSAALADFSCRARQRGLRDILDPTTFFTRPSDLSIEQRSVPAATGLSLDDNGWLHERHPLINPLVEEERQAPDSPLGIAHRVARSRVLGLRVLIDGSCLGPLEMGTQVATTSLVGALAASPKVGEVCVALPGAVPAYAAETFSAPKIRCETVWDGDLSRFGRCDIAHRPFQPDEGFDVSRWRNAADRVVVSILDLISYHVGTYSGDPEVWLRYRRNIQRVAREVDGIIVISDDVRHQVHLEQLPVDPSRVFVATLGSEHLTGSEAAQTPKELVERGFSAAEFLLCLGTNYSHKNRDLAIRAYGELCRRGWQGVLVLVGPAVPWGSSRAGEADAMQQNGLSELQVVSLPELPSAERNWLLRHASLVLYPTSAEGFGLVPFEAARFGTPTVFVGFGPLGELGGDQLVADDWSPSSLADAAEKLLSDPTLSSRQVQECLAAGSVHTWQRTASDLVSAYGTVLHRSVR